MVLLLAFACVKAPPSPESGLRGDSGDDTAAELGPSPCGVYSGVRRVGSTWNDVPTADYEARFGWTGTSTTKVTGLDDTVTLHTLARFSGSEGSFDLDRTETWRCDERGAWWLRSDATTTAHSGTSTVENHGVRDFSPGWLVRPVELVVSDAWSDTFSVTMVLNDGAPSTSEAACTSTVAAEETLALALGALPTRRINVDCIGVSSEIWWLAENVGLAADEDIQLVSYVR